MKEKEKIEFQLCTEADPGNLGLLKNRIAETKLDGRRIAIIKEDENVLLWGSDTVRTESFPEIIEAAKQIPGSFILDGELCVFNKEGKSIFPDVNARSHLKDKFKIKLMQQTKPATFVAFDILSFGGQDLRNEELQNRKVMLNNHFANLPESPIKVNKVWEDLGLAWQYAEDNQLEGIVVKDIHSRYTGKRGMDWLKVKRKQVTEIIATTYETNPKGITLISDEGLRCSCLGEQHKEVKKEIDEKGFANVLVRHMAGRTSNNKLREIVFLKLREVEGQPPVQRRLI
jgi:bifunctional non-homologous end joining protein LigD